MKQEISEQIPREGIRFEVNPKSINRSLFEDERLNPFQERTRRRILESLDEMDKNPDKYGRKFKTSMPKKTWDSKKAKDLEEMACELGDHMVDEVEEDLELAQRITNGQTWEQICNLPDTANWHRLIKSKNGCFRRVGGAKLYNRDASPAVVSSRDFYDDDILEDTVPLIAAYEE